MTLLTTLGTQRLGRPTHPAEAAPVDAKALEAELRGKVRGEIRFDDGSRALYATDASNYRQAPIGVVVPRNEEDVIETIAAARRHGAPVLGRGGGTSLAGQCCNVAVVLDFSKYMRDILELDPANKRARVQPGCVLDFLRGAAEKHKLTFGPDPSTHNHCTLGGMLGNNSCGVHSVMAGKTDDNTEELDILLYDGTRMKVGKTADDELERIIRGGGRRGEIYAKLKALRDKYAEQIRARYPQHPPPGFGIQPPLPPAGAWLRCRQGPGRVGMHLCHDLAGDAAPGLQPTGALASGARLSGRVLRRRPRHGGAGGKASRPGRDRRQPRPRHEHRGPGCRRPVPVAAGRRLAPGRVRRRKQARNGRSGPWLDGGAQEEEQAAVHEAL